MRSVGWGFAWTYWARHRLGMSLTLGYLLVLVLLVNAFPRGTVGPLVIPFLLLPLGSVVPYLLGVFGHARDGEITVRESGYPRRWLTLPLRTPALVGWPLALGGVTLTLFWLALCGLILRPAGLAAPWLWPAVSLVALLAWLQALGWWHFPVPFLRLLLRLLVLCVILGGMTAIAIDDFFKEVPQGPDLDASQPREVFHAVLSPYAWKVPQALQVAAPAALVLLGYLVAVAGVSRVRRGDVPIWRCPVFRGRDTVSAPPRSFASASDAMFWFDWERNGGFLPFWLWGGVLIVIQVGFECVFDDPSALAGCLVVLGFYLAIMACVGGAFPAYALWSHKTGGMPAFLAARPITTAALVGVKLQVGASSILLIWGVLYLVILAFVAFSRGGEVLVGWTRQLIEPLGWKGWLLLLLLVPGLPALIWKEHVGQLWVGLSGRTWVFYAMSPVALSGLTLLGLFANWVASHPESHAVLLAAAPWTMGAALALKLLAGGLVVRALRRRGLVEDRTLIRLGIAWVACAAGIVALAFCLTPLDIVSPWTVACGAILLLLPLVRLGLAPLALDWNRHR